MRQIDPKLLDILKTETAYERVLRTCAEEREKYRAGAEIGSGNPAPYESLAHSVSVGRHLRYVAWPPHRNYLIEINYLVSGSCRMTVGGREILMQPGDIFIPNQYTIFTREALEENDILVSFVLKPEFLEDACARMPAGSRLSAFLADTLRKEIRWNHYLHFADLDDIAVTNLIEILIREAFPCLDDENVHCGAPKDPEMMNVLLTTMLVFLSRDLDARIGTEPSNYDEMIRKTVERYINMAYKTGSLKELAASVKQSESALSRQIKNLFGCNFKELLLRKRFERSVMLLETTDLPVSDIAEAVGYENTSFFYRRFRALYGISPKDYRIRLAKEIQTS